MVQREVPLPSLTVVLRELQDPVASTELSDAAPTKAKAKAKAPPSSSSLSTTAKASSPSCTSSSSTAATAKVAPPRPNPKSKAKASDIVQKFYIVWSWKAHRDYECIYWGTWAQFKAQVLGGQELCGSGASLVAKKTEAEARDFWSEKHPEDPDIEICHLA